MHNFLDGRSIHEVDRHRCHIAAKFGVFVDEILTSLQRYTGYIKINRNHINHVIMQILVRILLLRLLLSCIYF